LLHLSMASLLIAIDNLYSKRYLIEEILGLPEYITLYFFVVRSNYKGESKLIIEFQSILSSRSSINLLVVDPIVSFPDLLRVRGQINDFLDTDNFLVLIGSLISYEVRLLLSLLGKKGSKVIALHATFPVSNSNLQAFVSDRLRREEFLKRIKRFIGRFARNGGELNFAMVNRVLIEAYEKMFLVKLDATARGLRYVNRRIVSFHMVPSPYFRHLLKTFYPDETFEIYNVKPHPITREISLPVSLITLMVLCPTNYANFHLVGNSIIRLMSVLSISRIILRPHPRFLSLGQQMLAYLEKIFGGKTVVLEDPFDSSLHQQILEYNVEFMLGYFSSAIYETKFLSPECNIVIDEEWNIAEYASELPSDYLGEDEVSTLFDVWRISGLNEGYNEGILLTNSESALYSPYIRGGCKAKQASTHFSHIVLSAMQVKKVRERET
jgi:hypothetical protein